MVDFEKADEAKTVTDYDALHFNCYAIFLKDANECKLKYGVWAYRPMRFGC
jgi:hypothetical protein